MAISNIGKNVAKATAHPISLGMGAFNYGMGTSSAGGAIAGTAASSLGQVLTSLATKAVFKSNPVGRAVGFLADLFVAPTLYNAGERIGNKVMPLSWGKNRLPNVGD